MHFAIRRNNTPPPDIFVKGQRVEVVQEFKYLGIILDSNLTFKKQIKKTVGSVKRNLRQFRFIRDQLSSEAAKLYLHSFILSHLAYCVTSWSQAVKTAIKPLSTLYKQALKVLDKKPNSYHHCEVIKKHDLLTFENSLIMANLCLLYRILNGLVPPPLNKFVTRNTGGRATRASTRGDCSIAYRATKFSQLAFSIKAAGLWNL